MPNPELVVLADPAYSHAIKVTILKPNGQEYKSFTTDQKTGVTESSALSTSKSFDSPPTSLEKILTVAIPENIILSRQIINWLVKIYVESTNGVNTKTNQIWSGRVSSFNKTGGYWSMELTNRLTDIDKGKTTILSANCPLIFGKCGAVKTSTEIFCTSLVGTELSIDPIPFVINSQAPYEVVIGDTSYSVVSFVIVNGVLSKVSLDRPPHAKPEIAFLNNTCNQSLVVCKNAYNNNVNYRGVILPGSVLSLNL